MKYEIYYNSEKYRSYIAEEGWANFLLSKIIFNCYYGGNVYRVDLMQSKVELLSCLTRRK